MIPISLPENLRDHPMMVANLYFLRISGGSPYLVLELIDEVQLENLYTQAINCHTARGWQRVEDILNSVNLELPEESVSIPNGMTRLWGYTSQVLVSTLGTSSLELRVA